MSSTSQVFDMLALPQRGGSDMARQLSYLFKGIDERSAQVETVAGWLEQMDEHGVGRVMIAIMSDDDRDWVSSVCRDHPDRFFASLVVDPTRGVDELRRIDDYVSNTDVKLLRLGPWRIQKPPTDRVYWPVYAKAVQLGIPVQINVGIPAPKTPGWVQDPIYVDEVCYEFPELTVIMTHVGYPWIGTVIRNLIRWDNCYLAMNSYAPRLWPSELVDLLRRRSEKFLYATEFPLMGWDRTLREIRALEFRKEDEENLLFRNAYRILNLPSPAVAPVGGGSSRPA